MVIWYRDTRILAMCLRPLLNHKIPYSTKFSQVFNFAIFANFQLFAKISTKNF